MSTAILIGYVYVLACGFVIGVIFALILAWQLDRRGKRRGRGEIN